MSAGRVEEVVDADAWWKRRLGKLRRRVLVGEPPDALSIAAVGLDLAARIKADTHGHVRVDVRGRDLQGFDHPQGRYWTQATGAAKTPRVLAHDDRVPLHSVTLTAIHEGAAGVEQARRGSNCRSDAPHR